MAGRRYGERLGDLRRLTLRRSGRADANPELGERAPYATLVSRIVRRTHDGREDAVAHLLVCRLSGREVHPVDWCIPPIKVTSYVDVQVLPRWRNRIQVLFSGDRDRFGASNAFGERTVESYTTVDWLSSFDVARGVLRVGVQNPLNRQYFTRDSQL